MIVHFAHSIGSHEPVLRMDVALKNWSVASSSDEVIQSDCCRLEVYEGEPKFKLLQHYFQRADHDPTTALIKMGLRYRELGLPGVSRFPNY